MVDTNNHTIRKITSSGVVTTLAGLAGAPGSADGTGSVARFNLPNSIAIDGSGNVYVADTFNHTIRKITPAGVVSTLAGLAENPGTSDGTGSAARFDLPFGVTADFAGNVFAADTANQTIRKITPAGVVTTLAGGVGIIGSDDGLGSAARFNVPRGVAVDGAGNVYVADEGNSVMRKITPGGAVSTLAGLPGAQGSADGSGSTARFNQAAGIAVNSAGALSVADTRNYTIRRGAAPLKQGALDPTFDAGNFTNGLVNAAVLQPDGKVVIGGSFNKVHGVVRHNLARLNADGTLDLTFDPGEGSDYGIAIGGLTLQSDGKLIIVGSFEKFNGISRVAGIARLNSNGSLDMGFDPGRTISNDGQDDGNGNATYPGRVHRIVLQQDGKIVVAGQFLFVITAPGQSVARAGVVRFSGDGTFDSSFDPGTGCVYAANPPNLLLFINGAAKQALGANSEKILLTGNFDLFDGHPVPGVVRLNTDGSFDGTFALESDPKTFYFTGLLVQANDEVLLSGVILPEQARRIFRLHSNGQTDIGFATEGFLGGVTGEIDVIAEQPDGKLLVGGFFHTLGGATANNIVRLETNGARDPTFDATSAGPSGFRVEAILVRPGDGQIFVGGYFSTFGGEVRNNIAWADSDGAVSSTYDGLPGVADYQPQIYALAVQPDGKILAGGFFSSLNGVPHYNLVRLDPDATLDPSLAARLGPKDPSARCSSSRTEKS